MKTFVQELKTRRVYRVAIGYIVAAGATVRWALGNQTQNLTNVQFVSAARLTATIPKEHNIAPPGWYMLFITDERGVPSVAKWVRVSAN